jgi:hypothetical protein
MRRALLALAAGAVLASCSGGDGGAARSLEGSIRVTTQPPDAVAAGAVLDPAPAVQLLDTSGSSLKRAGVAVTVGLGTPAATLAGTTTRLTDANGRASFPGLTVLAPPGAYRLHAGAPAMATATSEPFQVNAGAPAAVEAASPLAQSGPEGVPVLAAPAVRVEDAAGNPVAGVTVAFVVTAGGGTILRAGAATGSDGVASAGEWVLGAHGTAQALEASVSGVSGSPVVFTATSEAGAGGGSA